MKTIYSLLMGLVCSLATFSQILLIDSFPELFALERKHKIFKESKVFGDLIFQGNVRKINDLTLSINPDDKSEVELLLKKYFISTEVAFDTSFKGSKNIDQHLVLLWDNLTRNDIQKQKYKQQSSLLPLPRSYVVPGGRFREIYYWDSYFSMLGLLISHRENLVEQMLDNFAYLIDNYGFIPNGNRAYYLSRSQPPFFIQMVKLYAEHQTDKNIYKKYISQMQKEYDFWMKGKSEMKDAVAYLHVVKMDDGSILNRYFDNLPSPRHETYQQDLEMLKHAGRDSADFFMHLKAACESGWDFSSRWFTVDSSINTIQCANFVPIDLNSILYANELTLSEAYKVMEDEEKSTAFAKWANDRKNSMMKYLWNADIHAFNDYIWTEQKISNKVTAASFASLYFKVASPSQAKEMEMYFLPLLLQDGGIATTNVFSGQQWDAPNGWAPLQWMAVKGLNNYGYHFRAVYIAEKWLRNNERVFHNTGKMMEKYNVFNTSLSAGGGEYDNQDGFGWTNGVYQALKKFVSSP